MKIVMAALAAAIVISSTGAVQAHSYAEEEAAIERATLSMVPIYLRNKNGIKIANATGIVTKTTTTTEGCNATFISARHVLYDRFVDGDFSPPRYESRNVTVDNFLVTDFRVSETHDLAGGIFQAPVSCEKLGVRPVSLDTSKYRIGEKVFGLGSPLKPSIVEGRMIQWDDKAGEYYSSVPLVGGFSGGGLFSTEGKLRGMLNAAQARFLHTGMGVSIQVIKDFI